MAKSGVQKPGVPKYYGLRIYLSSTILYFFLVIPFLLFIGYQAIPEISKAKNIFYNDSTELSDSLLVAIDSLSNIKDYDFDESELDSLINRAIVLEEGHTGEETETGEEHGFQISVSTGEKEENQENIDPFDGKSLAPKYFALLFILLVVGYLVGYFYNRRFKRYFRLKRKKKEVPDKLHAYCKKYLLNTPIVNSLILTMPNVLVLLYSLIFVIIPSNFEEDIQKQMFTQLSYLTLVATLLEFLFVYYWQKHRVHIRYIDHIYSEQELRVQVFKRKGGKIRNRFLVASGMTTFLPLVIVMVYLVLSLTSIKELGIEEFSPEQKEILIGSWSKILNTDQDNFSMDFYKKLFYVSSIDSIVMLVGIGNGILVSFIYLLLFIKWTNQDITRPVKELLMNIRNTRGGNEEQYTVVRTNDEIGELAEGYNVMIKQIHDHVESISMMNRDLEKKVKERTHEVVMQKEEIEAQKEEIEAQLDLATLQRDTISNQKEQLLDSIRYAERIQSAILPPLDNLSDYLSDHFLLFKPRDIVSGDYYWTHQQDDKLIIAVADCTGHGVPGAVLSMLGISYLNEIVNHNPSIHANEILEKLKDSVIDSLHQTGSKGEAQDGIEIALCIIDTGKKSLEFAGANRPLYMIREGSIQHIRPDRMPIGIYDEETVSFTNHQIDLQTNDTIYLFSDGYVDQLGGPLRKTFRVRNFRKLLLKIQDHSMEEQKTILVKKLEKWQGTIEQIDDILVMGLKI